MEQYIFKSLIISGAHLPEKDIKLLKSNELDITQFEDDFSFTIIVNDETQSTHTGLHKQTRELIQYAKLNEINKIVFDCDGDIVPTLINFED